MIRPATARVSEIAAARPRLVSALAARGIHYCWVVMGVVMVTMVASAGLRALPGVLIKPFEAEFNWDRAAIAGAVSLNLVMYGAVGPLAGKLIDLYGPRLVAVLSVAVMLLGAVAAITMGNLLQLYLFWGLMVGAGTGGTTMVLGATVVNRWFTTGRGLAIGSLGAGNSAGQLLFLPVMMALAVTYGWRASVVLMVAIIGLLVLPAVVLLMRNRPTDVGLEPYGPAGGGAAGVGLATDASTPLSEAVRNRDFWLLSGSYFVCGATSAGLVGTHLIPHAVEHGIPEMAAASALALMGAMNVVGTLGSGFLCDRFDRRKLLACYYGFRGTAVMFLPLVQNTGGLTFFAILYGLDWFATVPPTSTLVADFFGKKSMATILGTIFLAHQAGAASAAYIAGLVYVLFGDYQWAFLSAGSLGLAAAWMSLQLRPVQRPAPSIA